MVKILRNDINSVILSNAKNLNNEKIKNCTAWVWFFAGIALISLVKFVRLIYNISMSEVIKNNNAATAQNAELGVAQKTGWRQNFKNYVKNLITNKVFIWCFFLTLIYLLSGFNKWIEIGVPVLAFFAFLFLSVKDGFCVFVYLHCFGLSNLGWYSCLMGTVICYAVVLLIKYLCGLYKKQYKFYAVLCYAMLIFIAISVAISFFHRPIYTGAIVYLCYLPLFYLVFAMRKDFDISRAIKFLFIGLIVSSILSLALAWLKHYHYWPFWDNKRFTAFTNCPNYFYMRVFVVLTYFMYICLAGKMKYWKFAIIYAISAILILSTISKTAICLLALFTLIFVVLFVKQNFKKRIKYVALFLLILAVIAAASYKFLGEVFERFFNGDYGSNLFSKLTTGRADIWLAYLKEWASSPWSVLFGAGMFGPKLFVASLATAYDTHSFFVMLIYRFGIVGILALIFMVYLMLKELNFPHPKFVAALPLIWFLLESLTDNTFQINNIFMLILVCQILFDGNKKTLSQTENDKAENLTQMDANMNISKNNKTN